MSWDCCYHLEVQNAEPILMRSAIVEEVDGGVDRVERYQQHVGKGKVHLGRADVLILRRGGVRQLPEDDIKAMGGYPILVNV